MDYKELIELYYRNELNESQAKELEDVLSSDEDKMREFLMAAHESNAIREALKEIQADAPAPQRSEFKLLSPKYVIPAAAALLIISSVALMLTYCDKDETNGALLGTSRAISFPLDLKIQKLNGKNILQLKLKDEWRKDYRLFLKNAPKSIAGDEILFTLTPKSEQPRKPTEQKYTIRADCFKLQADFEKGGAALNITPGSKTRFIDISQFSEGWIIEYK